MAKKKTSASCGIHNRAAVARCTRSKASVGTHSLASRTASAMSSLPPEQQGAVLAPSLLRKRQLCWDSSSSSSEKPAKRRSNDGVSLLLKTKPVASVPRHALGYHNWPSASSWPSMASERIPSQLEEANQHPSTIALSQGVSREQLQANTGEIFVNQRNEPKPLMIDQMDLIRSASRPHLWTWDDNCATEECVVSPDKLEVCFHPDFSESTASIIGNTPLKANGNFYYWEIVVRDKTYGTSVMFGLCRKGQQLQMYEFTNLIGIDSNGWSLSHKGRIWHNGMSARYCRPFPPGAPVKVGLFYNTARGELTYLVNGKSLGVAFCGLDKVEEDLYPVVGSTAKCTKMKITGSFCGYRSLFDRACFSLINNCENYQELINYLENNKAPETLIDHLHELTGLFRNPQKRFRSINERHQSYVMPANMFKLLLRNTLTRRGC